MKFLKDIKTIRKHARMRREWLARQASESRSGAPTTSGTGVPLHGRVRTDSDRLVRAVAVLSRDNGRLQDENRALREELRQAKIKQHNEFLEWLIEPENFNLMMDMRPDLMRQLSDALDGNSENENLSPVARVMSEPRSRPSRRW